MARAGLELARRLAEDAHGIASRVWRASGGPRAGVDERSPDAVRLDEIRRCADAALRNVVLPFWASHGEDEVHGGFLTHLGPGGRRLGPADKYLVPQARLVWTLAAAHRHGLTGQGYLELAGRGARFLVDRMWDPHAGGFVWAVRRDGTPLVLDKRTYGQAFAIYGLAEYALAAGSAWAREWAVRALDVLVARAGDGDLGFREVFDAEWKPVPGPRGTGKTVDVHLHVVEALTTLLEATGEPGHAALLRSSLDLVLNRGVHPRHHYALDELLDRDWRRRVRWRWPIAVSYGHAVELAWLARRAVDVLGDPPDSIRARSVGLMDHALRYGFDHRRGGVAALGPPLGASRFAIYLPAEWRAKRWWEQAEMLVGMLVAFEWTREPRYLAAFARQFEWVWPGPLDRDGDPFDPGAWGSHDWHDPYHGARALMEVSRRLQKDILAP